MISALHEDFKDTEKISSYFLLDKYANPFFQSVFEHVCARMGVAECMPSMKLDYFTYSSCKVCWIHTFITLCFHSESRRQNLGLTKYLSDSNHLANKMFK